MTDWHTIKVIDHGLNGKCSINIDDFELKGVYEYSTGRSVDEPCRVRLEFYVEEVDFVGKLDVIGGLEK